VAAAAQAAPALISMKDDWKRIIAFDE